MSTGIHRPRFIGRVAVDAALLFLLGTCAFFGTRELPLIHWQGGDGSYSTNDWQVLLLPAAAVIGLVFAIRTADALFATSPYLAVSVAACCAGLGWYASIWHHGVSAEAVRGWICLMGTVALGGTALLVRSLKRLAHHYGYPYRLWPSHVTAIARPHNGEPVDSENVTVLVAFHDEHGRRHDVLATIGHAYRHHPLFAIYDPTTPNDPTTLHIGIPYAPPPDRRTVWKDLKRELPAPGDDTLWEDLHHRDPGVGLMTHLDQIAAERQRGELTAEQFSTAKWRALETFVDGHRHPE